MLAKLISWFLSKSLENKLMSKPETKKEVKKSGPKPVPLHLRNPETKFLRDEGYGRDYKYPHNFKSGFVNESYLPKDINSNKFFIVCVTPFI